MSLLDKIFGTESERKLKKILPLVDLIESKADRYAAMSDDELRAQTDVLKKRLADGETLDDILPDAFATVREADWRVLSNLEEELWAGSDIKMPFPVTDFYEGAPAEFDPAKMMKDGTISRPAATSAARRVLKMLGKLD